MQYFVAMAILALAAVFDTTWAATVPKKRDADLATHVTGSGPTPMLVPFYDENLDPAETTFGIQKRGYFTCYNTAPIPVLLSDCEHVLDDIRAVQGNISVPAGLCMVWWEGTCKSRVCAKIGSTKGGYNRTTASVVDELTDPILNNCVKSGSEGITGDCPNMNGNCGTYRLSLEYHGSEQT